MGVKKKSAQLAFGAEPPPNALEPVVEVKPSYVAPPAESVATSKEKPRYRIRSTEAVLLSPEGRVVGFGTKKQLGDMAAHMGEVVYE